MRKPADRYAQLCCIKFTRCTHRNWKLLTGKKCPSPLIHITGAENVRVEQLQLINAPGFHVKIDGSRHVEARAMDIFVDRAVQRQLRERSHLSPSMRQTAGRQAGSPAGRDYPPQNPAWLNTDGIDPAGNDFYIHHCSSELPLRKKKKRGGGGGERSSACASVCCERGCAIICTRLCTF